MVEFDGVGGVSSTPISKVEEPTQTIADVDIIGVIEGLGPDPAHPSPVPSCHVKLWVLSLINREENTGM